MGYSNGVCSHVIGYACELFLCHSTNITEEPSKIKQEKSIFLGTPGNSGCSGDSGDSGDSGISGLSGLSGLSALSALSGLSEHFPQVGILPAQGLYLSSLPFNHLSLRLTLT